MARKPRRVRDLKRSPKGFPIYKQIIDTEGWVPHVLGDAKGAYWEIGAVKDKNGQLRGGLSEAGKKQMVNMILDGEFGEELKDVLIDHSRYWKIRDALLTWPNQESIAQEGLRELEVRRKK